MESAKNTIGGAFDRDRLTLSNCGYERCTPGYSFGPFVRDHLLIHYVAAGKGKYHRKDKTYDVCAGQAFVILPNEPTFYRADDEDPWEYYWVGVQGRALDAYIALLGLGAADTLLLTPPAAAELPTLMQEIIDQFLNRADNPLRTIGNLHLFLAAIYDETRDKAASAPTHNMIDEALTYIHNNFSYEISFEWLAKQLAVSRAHFFRLFKAQTGLSPQQYLVRYRIERAQKLLYRSALGVTEIAHSCGFNDLSHFSRIFRAYVGCAPGAYRHSGKYIPLIQRPAISKELQDHPCLR